MNLSLREKRLAYVAGFVAVVCGLYFLVIGPAWTDYSELSLQIESASQKILDAQSKRTVMQKALEETKTLEARFGDHLKEASEARHQAHLVRNVNALCQIAGVEITTVQPLALSLKGDWLRFPATFTMETDLPGLTDLLLRLRDFEPKMHVERVSVRANSDDPDQLAVQMTLSSYALNPHRKPSSTTAPRRAGAATRT